MPGARGRASDGVRASRLWPCYEADRARALVRAAVVGAAMLSTRSMAGGSDV